MGKDQDQHHGIKSRHFAAETHNVCRWSEARCCGTTRPMGEGICREEIGLNK
jgi:hypothetical protein